MKKSHQKSIKPQVKSGSLPAQKNMPQIKIQQGFDQALALYEKAQYQQALALCEQTLLPLASTNANILTFTGVCAFMCKQPLLAVKYCKQAIAYGAGADAWYNLALAYNELKQIDHCQDAYKRSLSLNANQYRAWNNLGNIIGRQATPQAQAEAIQYYQKAIALREDYAQAYINLGFAQENMGDKVNAESNYRLGLKYQPNHLIALNNLAQLLENSKQPIASLQYYQKAIQFAPQSAKAVGNAVNLRRQLCDWDTTKTPTVADLLAVLAIDTQSEFQSLPLLALPEASPLLQRDVAARYAQAKWGIELQHTPLVAANAVIKPHQRLKIGYLSADFKDHPVSHLVSDVILGHQRDAFEVFLYAYGPIKNEAQDPYRQRLSLEAEHFIVLNQLSDQAAAQCILDDEIDILVDLTGYTTHTRLGITALRPAPIIVSWLGYVGSLGEPRLADYMIGDAVVTPLSHAAQYSEKLVLMPTCFQPNRTLTPLAPAPTRQAEQLPDDAIVFCSFNQSFKFNPDLWDDWCAILRAVPNSVLWLAPAPFAETEQNLKNEAQKRGIASQRIIFATRKPLPEHHARIPLADIALDTFPYNSGTTASDLLRAGVPLVTRMGETFVSRMAASLLGQVGLAALVTPNRQAYISLAINLAQNTTTRQQIKAHLNTTLLKSSLFKPAQFCQHLETAYRMMYARLQQHLPPEHIQVTQATQVASVAVTPKQVVNAPTKAIIDIEKTHHDVFRLYQAGQYTQALERVQHVMPCQSAALLNIAAACALDIDDIALAEHYWQQAFKIEPDNPTFRANYALLLLKTGQYTKAWHYYEDRYHPDNLGKQSVLPKVPFPQWQGQSLEGKRVLLWQEQGLGDEIQFIRYIPALKALGAEQVLVGCSKALAPLFQHQAIIDRVAMPGEQFPPFDYWAHPMSIPLCLNTTLETIPTTIPYLTADEAHLQKWATRLPTTGLNVGLVWKGNAVHPKDKFRSLPHLDVLAPLWQVPGINFISLQKGQGEDEAKAQNVLHNQLQNQPAFSQPLLHLGADILDFADSAAIISQLDLVICVDTAVAHLTGALGKPCWVLLSAYGVDWRWLIDREDSPWYPNVMRLFRQKTPDSWGATIEAVVKALHAFKETQ